MHDNYMTHLYANYIRYSLKFYISTVGITQIGALIYVNWGLDQVLIEDQSLFKY